MALGQPAASTRSWRTTVRGRAGDRGHGKGGEERTTINFNKGKNVWDAREGRPPGMAGDRQGPRHRKAVGQDVSTERSRHRWLCSVVVRACREEGTTRQKARKKNSRTEPHSATGGRTAQSEREAGDRGGAQRADGGPRVAQKKNHCNEQQYQQRRVTTWAKGKGNGGRGDRKRDPPEVLKGTHQASGRGWEGGDQC